MKGAKIHPLTLVALFISSVLMAVYAYQNFRAEETGYGIVFLLLGLFLIGLIVSGLVMKRRSRNENSYKS